MSETELLHAFRKERSEQAFAELVRRYAGLVYSVAKRRLGNGTPAEDVTQIVFIRFASRPPNVQNHSELVAWLHRTTLNVTIDTLRSEIRRRAREQESVAMENVISETPGWEDISPKLDEALDQLNHEDRQVLLLRFFSRKSMRDVGAALGVNEDAAKMRVRRAVDRLRKQLGVRGQSCTGAVLVTLLAEHSLEAAPSQLVSRLAAMRLPVVVGASGIGGLFGFLLRSSGLKMAAAAVALVSIVAFYVFRSSNAPASDSGSAPTTPAVTGPTAAALQERLRSSGFHSSPALMTRPAKVVFHVLDAETGDGLPHTKIHFAYFGVGGAGESSDILTDDKGDAAIPEPEDATKNPGPNVFVVAEGHVPKVVGFHGDSVPAEYTIKLDPAMLSGGSVVDERGLPVSGVRIMIQGPGNKQDQIENVDFQTCPVTNREDGTWTCNYIPRDYKDEIRFILKKPGYAVTHPVVPVNRVDLTNLVLVIDDGYSLSGQITDLQKRPIVDARVSTLDGDRSRRLSTRTDENGVFMLSGIPGGGGADALYVSPAIKTNDNGAVIIRGLAAQGKSRVELAIQAKGYSPQTNTVGLSNASTVANFTLSPGNVFRGRVVDETGDPISNAVAQTDWDSQGIRAFEWTTRTDASGRFEWDSAPDRPVLFWFEAHGYECQRDVALQADGSDHEITLKNKALK
jgi:RNA polymerase sigma factor (sigma-70 family)